ncbi:hypothetical protein SELMODRAFT_419850 [Selaginella moellendorffii]|uniref:Uncharacterized protein n=1 Tax=Selaginella moellendorffii TaxID=88036 RepID=D8SAR1_SELML|nr:hypothetical protein SELMODRAFT_419850 [Selaginella moellendorffii]
MEMADILWKGLLRQCPTNGGHSFEPMDDCGQRKYLGGKRAPSERMSDFSQEEFDEVTRLRKIYDRPDYNCDIFKFELLTSTEEANAGALQHLYPANVSFQFELWNMPYDYASHDGLIAALAQSPATGMVALASHDKCVN